MEKLTEFQKDAIAEILNIGMGVAAASLSEMVQEPVYLSVPAVELLSQQKAASKIKDIASENLSAVIESFDGAFSGDAMLIFPESQSLVLVRALLKDEDMALEVLSEMEQEALIEVGNVILNACLGSLANIFNRSLNYQLPTYAQGSFKELLSQQTRLERESEGILLLNMHFLMKETNIDGYFIILMDVASLNELSKELENYFGTST
ncbi:MAG: chemotaxis protein CheC [Enterobacterales bacterium]|nr:chemotaxis protein CheC [Enterobacterales bacterium]